MKCKKTSIIATFLALATAMNVSAFAVDTAVQNMPFINGYQELDGSFTFRPDSFVSRAEIAKMIATAKGYAEADSTFPDAESSWANGYIGALQSEGIVNGDQDGNYNPSAELTRAELATIVSRLYSGGTGSVDAQFSDIEEHWAKNSIEILARAGVVKGDGNGLFRPDDSVKRAEAISMIMSGVLGRDADHIDPLIEEKLTNPFSDLDLSQWYGELVLAASGDYEYTVDSNGVEQIVEDTPGESTGYGAKGALVDQNLTQQKMLQYAIEDEYLARQEYELIIDQYGEVQPFTNIIKAEEAHIASLKVLFEEYNYLIPIDSSKDHVVIPSSLNEAYETGVTAEIDNIAMYDKFLTQELPEDIEQVFINLRDASKNHLAAFQNKVQ